MKQQKLSGYGAVRVLSCLAAVMLIAIAALAMPSSANAQNSVRPPSDATTNMTPGEPGTSRAPEQFQPGPEADEAFGRTQGDASRTDFWSVLRHGNEGYTAVQGPQTGYAIQSTGEQWRAFRNTDLATYGWWGLAGVAGFCLLFYLLRGPIRIESGRSGKLIERFGFTERTGHWLLAISFIVLAVTGLNMLYGRQALLPLIGPDAFAALTLGGKWAHFVSAFIFMLGLVWITVQWIAHNFPHWSDFVWLAKGGGFIVKSHPPAKKFNAGQKIIFWLVVLGGISVSLSGIALLLPFEFALFSKTFAFVNSVFGTELRTDLTPMQEMQLSQVWHTMVALFLTAVIVAHIYIGTIGMEGGFEAMGSGKVDLNWAKEHHSLWVKELEQKGGTAPAQPSAPAAGQQQPAE